MNNTVRYVLLALIGAALVYFTFIKKPPSGNGVTGHVAMAAAPDANRPEEHLFHVRTPLGAGGAGLDAELSSRSGGVRTMHLNGDQFRRGNGPAMSPADVGHVDARMNTSTTWAEELLPLRAAVSVRRAGTVVTPSFFDFVGRQIDDGHVEFRWSGADLEVVRTVSAEGPFALHITTQVTNRGASADIDHALPVYLWVERGAESGGFFQQSWRVGEGLCKHGDDLYRERREKLIERNYNDLMPGNAAFAAVGNLYFTNAILPRGQATARCRIAAEDRPNGAEAIGSVFGSELVWPRVTVGTGETRTFEASAFLGPKDTRYLKAADGVLTDTVNLGFFALIARVLVKFLQFLYSHVHNWGVAIILLTVTVRILLYPVLARGVKSMAMMARLKPELDEINAKFADNQEAKGLATMELYRRHGVNPVSGCLPQLAQLPVWWALYATLQTSVELFHAPFAGWLHDLSAPDPYYVLPLVLGALIFMQQKLMPMQGGDPAQAKMMLYFMPIFLTGISLFLPSGLALYMMVNSVLGMAQQKITKAQLDKLKTENASGEITVKVATETSSK